MRCIQLISLGIIGAALAAAPAALAQGSNKDTHQAYVSIVPQKFLVDRIGGDLVRTEVLVRPGQSPHSYSPTPQQVVALDRADVYFAIGLPLEEQLVTKIRDRRKDFNLVDTTAGINYRHMTPSEVTAHEAQTADQTTTKETTHVHKADGSCCAHHAGEPDPHIWLCPDNAQIMARHMFDALVKLAPQHEQTFKKNYVQLIADLKAVDEEIAKQLEPLKGRSFYVFHPAYGYLGDAYGLKQVAVEVEGKEPTPQQLVKLIQRARSENVQVIFVQPQFSDASAKLLAQEIGGTVVALDPLAYDYIDNLRKKAAEIRKGLDKARS